MTSDEKEKDNHGTREKGGKDQTDKQTDRKLDRQTFRVGEK